MQPPATVAAVLLVCQHCTALVETRQGQFELLHWADHKEVLLRETELTEDWDAIPQVN